MVTYSNFPIFNKEQLVFMEKELIMFDDNDIAMYGDSIRIYNVHHIELV